MTNYVDFAHIKAQVSIEKAADFLELQVTTKNDELRAACPACKAGGDRAIMIKRSTQSFYCWAAHAHGDCIGLVAHVKGISNKQAADTLARRFLTAPPRERQSPQPKQEPRQGGFDAEAYGAQLDPEHPSVMMLGFSEEVAKALSLGFCSKGVLSGTVAIPLRLEDGTIAGFIGIQDAKLPSRWNLTQKVVPIRKGA